MTPPNQPEAEVLGQANGFPSQIYERTAPEYERGFLIGWSTPSRLRAWFVARPRGVVVIPI